MSRLYKTSPQKRTTYIYYDANGRKLIELKPGKDGVTEAGIEMLHAMDDAEVDKQRRQNYRVSAHLDGYRNRENEDAVDRNGYLADNCANPEAILITEEDEASYQERLKRLTAAMESLLPQQLELFKKVYVDKRTNTDIAAEEGVTEAAIRNRLKKIHEKLRKYFP
ncbi:MAG: Sigma-70 region 4 type 2 [Desulfotomaculum sp. 46_296]|nr:MAG: Sigma-70 region 4 type 2 [Desulfotomaculum sp. 46_296]